MYYALIETYEADPPYVSIYPTREEAEAAYIYVVESRTGEQVDSIEDAELTWDEHTDEWLVIQKVSEV